MTDAADGEGVFSAIVELVERRCHAEQVTTLREELKFPEGVAREVQAWCGTVPRARLRKRSSVHWRAGVASLRCLDRVIKAEDLLNEATSWEAPSRAKSMEAARSYLLLAVMYAGEAWSAMCEASVRIRSGRARSPSPKLAERVARLNEALEAAAASEESIAGAARRLSFAHHKTERYLGKRISALKKRGGFSN